MKYEKKEGGIKKRPAAQGSRVKEHVDPMKLDGLWIMCFTGDCISPLSELSKIAKDKRARDLINSMQNRAQLRTILKNPLPKVRKNVAKLIGALAEAGDAPALELALVEEDTLFVIPSIILALGSCGNEKSGDAVKEYVQSLPPPTTDTEKHIKEIKEAANAAMSRLSKRVNRSFTGLSKPIKVALRAPFECGNLLQKEAEEKGIEGILLGDDFTLSTADLTSLFALRTFEEMLLPIGEIALPPLDLNKQSLIKWASLFEPIAESFISLLSSCLSPAPFPYRIELRGVPHSERSTLVHALSSALDSSELINSPSAYDAQLRIDITGVSTKIYAQLNALPDPRFSYREKSISASISPVNAALIMQFAKPFMKEAARIIDPCCGSGTLLIERGFSKPCKQGVGVDIDPNALTAARQNIKNSSLNIEAVGGDLIAFKPNAQFDELYANLPFGTRVGTSDSNAKLYKSLIGRLNEYVKPGGIAVLYTTQRAPLMRIIQRSNLNVIAEKRMEAGGLSPWAIIVRI